MGSTLFAIDDNDEVINHVIYDDWGKPLTDLPLNQNYAGIDNINNYAGYTYDEVLELYFVQYRFYNADTRQFTQEDPIKDGYNWYAYCEGNPLVFLDSWGLAYNKNWGNDITYGGKKTQANYDIAKTQGIKLVTGTPAEKQAIQAAARDGFKAPDNSPKRVLLIIQIA